MSAVQERLHPKWRTCVIAICTLLFGLALANSAFAQAYSAPTTVQIYMYAHNSVGGILNPNDLYLSSCKANDTRVGCTRMALGPYPFGATNPVTVSIEGTAVDNRYLRDVLPVEMSAAAFHPTALRAQAIAARTYLFAQIRAGAQINNSTQFQAFVPRTYDTLTTSERGKIDTAVAGRLYMSLGNDLFPIVSQFFADVPLRTLSGGTAYLAAVEDPISSYPSIILDGHGHGMSQKGASRWARGNLSFNVNNWDLGPWPVVWSEAAQILTHYYTGIHIRNADNGNAILTPTYRFVELNMRWSPANGVVPPAVCPGASLQLTAWVQNTGTTTWPTDGSVYYSYLIPQGFAAQQANNSAAKVIPSQPVAPGAAFTATLTIQTPSNIAPGTILGVNPSMFGPKPDGSSVHFGSLEAGRPWPLPQYSVPIIACPKRAYLPLLRWPPGVPASANPILNAP